MLVGVNLLTGIKVGKTEPILEAEEQVPQNNGIILELNGTITGSSKPIYNK